MSDVMWAVYAAGFGYCYRWTKTEMVAPLWRRLLLSVGWPIGLFFEFLEFLESL